MDKVTLLAWLCEYSHVLEYNADARRAYIQDEDSEEASQRVSVSIVRQLIADNAITMWRAIGEWNNGYNTYKPRAWVEAWNINP